MQRERVAVYGKGGGGKSFVSTNLSVELSRRGLSTLQIGCDPKHDSTRSLTSGTSIRTALSYMEETGRLDGNTAFGVVQGVEGVACVETGGPEPGVGCAGRGIVSAFKLFKSVDLLDKYDAVVLDVLGDVVCGGFAVPMQHGFAEKVVVVVSNTIMSMYAANNIARALVRYRRNGVFLAGMIANNLRDDEDEREIRRFAEGLKAPVIAAFRHDPLVRRSERMALPLLVAFPDRPTAGAFSGLADAIINARGEAGCPTPYGEEDLDRFFRSLHE